MRCKSNSLATPPEATAGPPSSQSVDFPGQWMRKLEVHRIRSIDWRPTAVVALVASPDGARIAAARENGSLEVWIVSPGSVGWHCQLTIQGNLDSRVSSLVWCLSDSSSTSSGRLFSSSIDGSISEWDLFTLEKKVIVDSIGVTIWQMAMEPYDLGQCAKASSSRLVNKATYEKVLNESESSETDDDDVLSDVIDINPLKLAVGCDDGCRIYTLSSSDRLTYSRLIASVKGRILSVSWSLDAKFLFGGSTCGLISCWDTSSYHEKYRITVGQCVNSGNELCIWSLLSLRCGTLVSGDSTGCVKFWDGQHGTLLQEQNCHNGDVTTLAVVPNHNRVFSSGSDGQVILYKLSGETGVLGMEEHKENVTKWVYVGYSRAHTHDVRALTIATPISREDSLPVGKVRKKRRREKPLSFSYHKWAHTGVPMLISAGDDAKLMAFSAKDFTQFSPHDICPAPQRVCVQLVNNIPINEESVALVQSADCLDILHLKSSENSVRSLPVGTRNLARVQSKKSQKIICSSISRSGSLFAYSDQKSPNLFALVGSKSGKSAWSVSKMRLPKRLPRAHCMVFSVDSSCLILSGSDRKIYVVDVSSSSELVHTFIPRRKENDLDLRHTEPPITKMFTSFDGQWLAAVNSFGDIYVFNLEIHRQHWFISRLNGASVTAAGFSPWSTNVFVVTTSLNEVYVFDVDVKQLGEWSRRNTSLLPRRFQEFPGEVIGLSFPPSSSSSVIVYSSSAMCLIDFRLPIEQDEIFCNGSDNLIEAYEAMKNSKSKQKRKAVDEHVRNFEFCAFKHPVLFAGHLSDNSLLVVEKPWMDVLRTFEAPVHRNIYGT